MALFYWDHTEGGNVEHIAEHGLTPEDVEEAFANTLKRTKSRSTKRPAIFGETSDGRIIFVVYEFEIDDDGNEIIYVSTAYTVGDEP